MKNYKVRKTQSWLYSIDLFENWVFKETISYWLNFENSNEIELNNFSKSILKVNENIWSKSFIERLSFEYFKKYFLKKEEDWLELDFTDNSFQDSEWINENLKINVDNIIEKIISSNDSYHDKMLNLKKLFLDMIIQSIIYKNEFWFNKWFLNKLYFSWWTSINRCYFWNYRFSEDIDFFLDSEFSFLDIKDILYWIRKSMRRIFITKHNQWNRFQWTEWFEPKIEEKSFWNFWWKYKFSDDVICNMIKNLSFQDELWFQFLPEPFIQIDFTCISWNIYKPEDWKEKRKVTWFFLDIEWEVYSQSIQDLFKSKKKAFLWRNKDRDFLDLLKFQENWFNINSKEIIDKMNNYKIVDEKN